jgi:putative peptidoglycan lipid II flippase
MQLPIGLFGVAIASATLPAISRSVASGDQDEFRHTLSRSLGFVFLLTVPSAVGLAVLGRPVIAAIFEGGKFNAYDTRQTALALSFYAVGLVGYSVLKVLNPAFYAMRDSQTPMYVSLGTIAVNYAAATLLITTTGLGHVGLAMALSVVSTFSALVQFVLMRNLIGGIHGRGLFASLSKIVVAAGAMGLLVTWVNQGMETAFGVGRNASLASVALCVPLGFVAFYGACMLLRVPELSLAAGAFRRRREPA